MEVKILSRHWREGEWSSSAIYSDSTNSWLTLLKFDWYLIREDEEGKEIGNYCVMKGATSAR